MNIHTISRRAESGGRPGWLIGLGLLIALIIIAGGVWLIIGPDDTSPVAEDTHHEEAHEADMVALSPEAQASINLALGQSERRPWVAHIEATGIVAPNETRVAHIRPLARGLIERVHVKLGDRVRAGQPLVSYDNIELGELIGDYLSESARLQEAQAQQEVARKSLERAEQLITIEAIARKEVELRQAGFQTAQAVVRRQQADLAKIKEKLRRFGLTDADIERLSLEEDHQLLRRTGSHNALKAPFDGIIIKSEAAEGETIGPERELFTLVDTSTVWVLADVYEKDLGVLRIGRTVEIRITAYPDEVFRGDLTHIGDVIDPATRTAKVRCVVANPNRRLKLDMFAALRIPSRGTQEAIVVPETAIQWIEDQPVVFVKVSETQFQKRDVQLGARREGWIEITGGLGAGETVVQQGGFSLKSELLRDRIGGQEHGH